MQQLQMLWAAVASSTLMIAAAPLVVAPIEAQNQPTAWIIGLVGLGGPAMSVAWGRLVARDTVGTARWVPRWALAESGAVFGLVSHMMGGHFAMTVALGGLAVGMVVANLPRDGA